MADIARKWIRVAVSYNQPLQRTCEPSQSPQEFWFGTDVNKLLLRTVSSGRREIAELPTCVGNRLLECHRSAFRPNHLSGRRIKLSARLSDGTVAGLAVGVGPGDAAGAATRVGCPQ